jgi:signal transduction histidine kinase
MQRFLRFLNPLAHLGERHYSVLFPIFSMLVIYGLCEFYAYTIAKNPMAVGSYVIFISVALIIYFAFREGLRGGLVAVLITIAYYYYIIVTRHYTGEQYHGGVETTITLGMIYLLLAWIIGWLKQTIDRLIEQETDEKHRLQTIIQQLPVGVLITDSKGILQQSNRQVDQIIGQKMPVGFHIGQDNLSRSKINGKPINPSTSPLVHALSTGKAVTNKEFVYERKDGKTLHLQISSAPIHNRGGKIIAAASIIADITAQKELEARKDDFVNMASHELKTPITSMKLYVDTLLMRLKKTDDAKAQKILAGIKGQTERLQELVNDLLDVSRLQTGKLTFHKEQFRLDTLINETIEGLQGMTNKQELVFVNKKTAVNVLADRFRIYQVLTNLITNAVKYSPSGSKITITLQKEAGKVVVSVKDTGIGIAKDQHKKIFDRLYQVTDMQEKTFPGFGMGLYISKEIIKRHRGTIWVESEKGKGATFSFSLPLAKK